MFALHETTRRRVCRAAFIALCIVPTVATAAWIIDRRLPSHSTRQLARLSGLLEARAAMVGYGEPRPGVQRCSGIMLSDSTTGHQLVALTGARLHRRDGAWSLGAESAAVETEQLAALAAKVGAWLVLPGVQLAELRFGRLELATRDAAEGAARKLALVDVQGRLERGAAGVARLRLTGRPADAPTENSAAMALTVERSVAAEGVSVSVILEPSATAIPVAVFAAVVPGFGGLNADAQFVGGVQWTVDATGKRGAARGRLEGLALSALLPEGSPHTISGRAAANLSDYRWRGERLERVEAAATADAVEASRSLAAAAEKFMYCQAAPGAARGEESPVVLDRVALHFVLDHRGFTVFGDLPQSASASGGCLAASGDRPILLQPPYVDIPAGAWIQFVAGPASSWVPATGAAVRMAGRLPLP